MATIEPRWKMVLDSLKTQQRTQRNTGYLYKKAEKRTGHNAPTPELFCFNPNTISVDSLQLLGFSPKQAASIDRYRKSGARFVHPHDFSRLYVVSSEQFERLRPYVVIPVPSNGERKSPLRSPDMDLTRARDEDCVRPIKLGKRDSINLSYQLFSCELNAVDSLQLLIFPGIGPYTAHKIIQYRKKLGGFVSVSQLSDLGIDPELVELMSKKCSVNRSKVRKMRLDSLNWDRLRQHPYVGNYLARGFQLYIRYRGYPQTWAELIENQIITEEKMEKLKYYIDIP